MPPERTPRVAVVVPCYNDGQTLPATIASVRAQEPCELVVVDDGSDDPATVSILAELREQGVRVVHQARGGLPRARMAGVRATSARYVLPLDSDDLLAPAALARLADALDADQQAAVAWGDLETFGQVRRRRPSARALDPWQLTYMNEIPVASLIRRDALLEAGGWRLEHGYEDWDLWLALAESGRRGVYVPGVVLHYRVDRSRMLGQTVERHNERYAELRKRHPRAFEQRRLNWWRSRAPRRLKLLLPLVASLPVSAYDKHRLGDFVSHPLGLVLAKLRQQRDRRAPT